MSKILTDSDQRLLLREKRAEERLIKRRKYGTFWDYALITLGSVIYAYGLACFAVPNNIAAGGVTGVATILNSVWKNTSVGFLYALINLPLIVIGFVFVGRKTMFKTLYSVIIISVSQDILFNKNGILSQHLSYEGDELLAAIFGGVIFGVGMGIIYLRDGTAGGTDILMKIIHEKFPYISVGNILLGMDIIIFAAAIAAYGKLESALYAIVCVFISIRAVDIMIYGSLEAKLLLIFSDKYQEIAAKIMTEQKLGVTLLNGSGGFSGDDKKVICCAVHKNQYTKIKETVKTCDSKAFMIIANAGEVLGEGFTPIETEI